jgi:hypothetical protein
LLVAELGLRALSNLTPSQVFARVGDTPMERLESQRNPPGTLRFLYPCNSLGEYDEEFVRRKSGDHLMATIGDSFSYGIVPHDYHFSTVCERHLGIPVYNMGVPSIGPPEYHYLLEHEALPLDPELIVVDIFVGNDLIFPYEVTPTLDPFLRSWFDRRNALLWLVPERCVKLAREKKRRASEDGPVGAAQGEFAKPSSAAGKTLEEQFPWLADPMKESPSFSQHIFTQMEVQRAESVCSSMSPAFTLFEDFMSRIHRSAGKTPVAVMLIPDEFQVEDAVWQSVLEKSSAPDLDRDRPQKALLPWFEHEGIPCLDLLPVLRAVPPMPDGKRHVYHLRDSHFNARGNRATGEALSEFVRQHWPQLCARVDAQAIPR